MKNNYGPRLTKKLKDFYIFWFESSNSYLVLDSKLQELMTIYFETQGNRVEFSNAVLKKSNYTLEESESYFSELSQLIDSCQESLIIEDHNKVTEFENNDFITKQYHFEDITISINYDSERLKSLIHPQISHLELRTIESSNCDFHIMQRNDTLLLFKDNYQLGAYTIEDYHLLQGKFAMELICVLTNSSEEDWIGTFHASTVARGNKAIMLIGKSGSGKSTLASLLMAHGFNVVADDITPMYKDKSLVINPTSISVKEGAFKSLSPLFNNFETFAQFDSNSKKGTIKYIPINTSKQIEKTYKCNKLVLVDYKTDTKTNLKKATIDQILEVLIPDSWISPKPHNAKMFLEWLGESKFYHLTYGDNNSVIDVFNELLYASE